MRTFNHTWQRFHLASLKNAGSLIPVLVKGKQGKLPHCALAVSPKPQHIQYSKAVATLCDAVQEYGDFLGSVVAKDKYDKAIGAVRNLQAQAVIQSNMAI